MYIFADQISKVALANNNLRIELHQQGADNETPEAGTIILPVNQANKFLNDLANGLKALNDQVKARNEQSQA